MLACERLPQFNSAASLPVWPCLVRAATRADLCRVGNSLVDQALDCFTNDALNSGPRLPILLPIKHEARWHELLRGVQRCRHMPSACQGLTTYALHARNKLWGEEEEAPSFAQCSVPHLCIGSKCRCIVTLFVLANVVTQWRPRASWSLLSDAGSSAGQVGRRCSAHAGRAFIIHSTTIVLIGAKELITKVAQCGTAVYARSP